MQEEIRTKRVRFTVGPLGCLRPTTPLGRFDERSVAEGEEGDLIVEGELPFEVPEGYVLVRVEGDLYAPVHPGMIEVV